MTSFDVIARLRRILGSGRWDTRERWIRMRKASRLFAPGRGTRLVDMISGGTKTHQAEMLFGNCYGYGRYDRKDPGGKSATATAFGGCRPFFV